MFDNFFKDVLDQPVPQTQPEIIPEQKVVLKGKTTRTVKRNHPGRIPIPDHLERVEIVLDIPEEKKVCPETGKPLYLFRLRGTAKSKKPGCGYMFEEDQVRLYAYMIFHRTGVKRDF